MILSAKADSGVKPLLMSIQDRYGLEALINAAGFPTIVGANVAAPEVIEAVRQALAVNVEIDELQRRACQVIAQTTGAEAGCVTSSCSSAVSIAVAAAMTGPDFGRIQQLPDTTGMANEVILQAAHDINFGAPISQMVRLAGARVVRIGSANHAGVFQLASAFTPPTAAVLFVVSGAIQPEAQLLSLEQCVAEAGPRRIPVIVDAAAEPDLRPYLRSGADLVVASGHKAIGAPTSGLICGRKALVRACYLQNWGIGRAMKVGKEGIVGLMAALELWAKRDPAAERARLDQMAAIFDQRLSGRADLRPQRETNPRQLTLRVDHASGLTARRLANLLREGHPPIWPSDATDSRGAGFVLVDLARLSPQECRQICERIVAIAQGPPEARQPAEDLPYHDLYRSCQRLLRWPD